MATIFDDLTPGICGMTPSRFERVKWSVLAALGAKAVKRPVHQNTSKNALQHTGAYDLKNTAKEQMQPVVYVGSYNAITGEYE